MVGCSFCNPTLDDRRLGCQWVRQSRPTKMVNGALVGCTNVCGSMEICGFANDSGICCESSNFEKDYQSRTQNDRLLA